MNLTSNILFEYIYIYNGILIISIISFILIIISYLTTSLKKSIDFQKISAYECGFQPFESSRHLFNVKFYLVGILFIIFDLEIVFLFPWCVSFKLIGFYGLFVIIHFIIILTIGFLYEIKKGCLDFRLDFLYVFNTDFLKDHAPSLQDGFFNCFMPIPYDNHRYISEMKYNSYEVNNFNLYQKRTNLIHKNKKNK